jgi:hypothetical protein
MTRTAIRHLLSALAALAVSLTLIGQAAAGDRKQTLQLHPSQLQWAPTIQTRPGFPTGIATQKPQQGTTTHYEWRWFEDYSGGK